MTSDQKKVFAAFPEGITVKRYDIFMVFIKAHKNRYVGFERAFIWLCKKDILEVIRVDAEGQFVRRRTTEEIREIYFNKKPI